MTFNVQNVFHDPPLPEPDKVLRRQVIRFISADPAVNGVRDRHFLIMLERHHKVRKHPVDFGASGVAALVARDSEPFRPICFMAEDAAAVIPEHEKAFFAHGTNVFNLLR